MSTHAIPQTVGSRELKTRLGTYLRRVREGQCLIVTDRGRPVAELRPLERGVDDLEDRLHELIAKGVVSGEARQKPLAPFEPLRCEGEARLTEAILEDREDRF